MTLNKSVVCPVLVGRADDLAVINRLMEQATQSRGQIALISGEAGLGKSRLVSETVKSVEQLGAQILKGNCFETDRALPYAPLLDLLRIFYSKHLGENLSHYFGTTSNELARILPELSETIHTVTSAPMLEPEQEKHRLFQALTQFMIERSGNSLMIVIEDLHWGDDTSLEFLLYLARRIQNQRILLLLTYRSEEMNPALEHFLAELDRHRFATELSLAGLSQMDVDKMLQAIFSLNRPIRPEFMTVIYPLTEGNPFFIEEVLKSMIVAGEIFYADGTWDRKPIEELNIPRSVQDAVRHRAARLSDPAREVLSIAAVIGQRFEFSLLQDLTARNESELLSLLKELVNAQLIVELSVERYLFRHALTREAVYSQMMERERMRLHQKIGESIESIARESSDEQLANLAYHFYQANVWQKAMDYSQRAGEKAQALYAPHAAVEHFTHSMDSARKLSLSPSISSYLARGSAYERLGDFERARSDYESALQAAHLENDKRAEWLSLLGLGALWAGRDYSETGNYYQHAYNLAREINDPELVAASLNRLGNWNANVENPDEGLQYHQEALKLFQELEDRKGIAESFDLLGMANYIHGDLVQSEYYYKQALESFRELGYREGLASSPASMLLNNGNLQSGMAVLARTDRAAALRSCEEALRISRDIGWRSGEAYALIILGNYLGLKGKYTKAFDYLVTSFAIATEIAHRQWTVYSRYCLGMLYLDILDFPHAQEHLQEALTLAKKIGSQWWITNITGVLAPIYILEKEYERATSEMDAALRISTNSFLNEKKEFRALTLGQRRCWYACAELSLSRGEPHSALWIVDALIASSAHVQDGGVISRLWLLRGQILTSLNQVPEAEETLLIAQREAAQEEEKPLLWRIDISLGKLYQTQTHREEASNSFVSAQKIIEDIAAEIPDTNLRENFLKRALSLIPEARSLTIRQKEKREYGGLTTREREVARIIAKGKSNREAAEALVVSERTIETHVENILTKLGFSSRAQIAAWAVETGLSKNKED